MALFDPCMEFEIFLGQMTSFEVLLKCHSLTLSKKCLRLRPALSMCLSERINWIISRIPNRISKIIFVQGSYESLGRLERPHFFNVQSGKITVWQKSDKTRKQTNIDFVSIGAETYGAFFLSSRPQTKMSENTQSYSLPFKEGNIRQFMDLVDSLSLLGVIMSKIPKGF